VYPKGLKNSGGAGFGAAAGPVGATVGALTGLALYGIYRVFKD
jgi:hypothetical protein